MSSIAGFSDPVIAGLLRGPAGVPPLGVTAASTASQTRGPVAIIILIITFIIPTIALAIRSYTTIKLLRRWHIEDTILILVWLLFIFYVQQTFASVPLGAGQHMWNIMLSEFYRALYYINVCSVLYTIMVAMIKVAILLQYIRIFIPHRVNGRRGTLWYLIWTTIISNIVFYTIIAFFTIWICYPRAAYFDPYVKGTCRSWQALSQAVCIFTVISDFTVFLLPIYPLSKLQMARKKKIMIGLLFAVGFIDCVASIVRSYYMWVLIDSPDISWNIVIMAIWSWLEMSFGILVACLPVTPRFYKHLKQKTATVTSSFRSSRLKFYHSSGNGVGRTHTNAVIVKTEVKISSAPRLAQQPTSEHHGFEEITEPEKVTLPNNVET